MRNEKDQAAIDQFELDRAREEGADEAELRAAWIVLRVIFWILLLEGARDCYAALLTWWFR